MKICRKKHDKYNIVIVAVVSIYLRHPPLEFVKNSPSA